VTGGVILKQVQDDAQRHFVILKQVQDDERRHFAILKQVQDDARFFSRHPEPSPHRHPELVSG